MRYGPETRRGWAVCAIVAATVFCIPPSPASPSSPHQQAAALADLLSGIASCHTPPCIGTDFEGFTSLVRGRFVSDGDFYTDVGAAYPGFAHLLQGAIVWDVGDEVDSIFFILTRFDAPPAAIIAELEGALFECQEDVQPEEGQQEWTCRRGDTTGGEFEFDLYIGTGVLLVDL